MAVLKDGASVVKLAVLLAAPLVAMLVSSLADWKVVHSVGLSGLFIMTVSIAIEA